MSKSVKFFNHILVKRKERKKRIEIYKAGKNCCVVTTHFLETSRKEKIFKKMKIYIQLLHCRALSWIQRWTSPGFDKCIHTCNWGVGQTLILESIEMRHFVQIILNVLPVCKLRGYSIRRCNCKEERNLIKRPNVFIYFVNNKTVLIAQSWYSPDICGGLLSISRFLAWWIYENDIFQ